MFAPRLAVLTMFRLNLAFLKQVAIVGMKVQLSQSHFGTQIGTHWGKDGALGLFT